MFERNPYSIAMAINQAAVEGQNNLAQQIELLSTLIEKSSDDQIGKGLSQAPETGDYKDCTGFYLLAGAINRVVFKNQNELAQLIKLLSTLIEKSSDDQIGKGLSQARKTGGYKGYTGFHLLAGAINQAAFKGLKELDNLIDLQLKLINKVLPDQLGKGLLQACETGDHKGCNGFFGLVSAITRAVFKDQDDLNQLINIQLALINKLSPKQLYEGLLQASETGDHKGCNGFYWLAGTIKLAVSKDRNDLKQLIDLQLTLINKLLPNQLFNGLSKARETGDNKGCTGFYWLASAIKLAVFKGQDDLNQLIGIQLALINKLPPKQLYNGLLQAPETGDDKEDGYTGFYCLAKAINRAVLKDINENDNTRPTDMIKLIQSLQANPQNFNPILNQLDIQVKYHLFVLEVFTDENINCLNLKRTELLEHISRISNVDRRLSVLKLATKADNPIGQAFIKDESCLSDKSQRESALESVYCQLLLLCMKHKYTELGLKPPTQEQADNYNNLLNSLRKCNFNGVITLLGADLIDKCVLADTKFRYIPKDVGRIILSKIDQTFPLSPLKDVQPTPGPIHFFTADNPENPENPEKKKKVSLLSGGVGPQG